jgi:hypothetical protein
VSVDAQAGCGGVAAPVEVATGQVAVTGKAAAALVCRTRYAQRNNSSSSSSIVRIRPDGSGHGKLEHLLSAMGVDLNAIECV